MGIGILWWSSGYDSVLPLQEVWVQSLVKKLRSPQASQCVCVREVGNATDEKDQGLRGVGDLQREGGAVCWEVPSPEDGGAPRSVDTLDSLCRVQSLVPSSSR